MRCPKGFVIPDNPLDSRVIFAPGPSGCARQCEIAGYFTDHESSILRILIIVASVIGLPMISTVLWTWLSSKIRMEKQYLIFCFVASSAFFSLWMIIGSGTHKCHDNATEIDQSDGMSYCALQGAAIVYCLLAISFAWFISCFELFYRVVWKKSIRHHHGRIRIHLCLIFVLPAFAIVYGSIRKVFGFSRLLPFCMFAYTAPENVDFTFLYVPMFVATVIGAMLLLAVMWHTVCTTKASIVGIQGSTQTVGNQHGPSALHDVAVQAHKQSIQALGLELPSISNTNNGNVRNDGLSAFGNNDPIHVSSSQAPTSNRIGYTMLSGSILGSFSHIRKSAKEGSIFSTFARKLRFLRTLLSFFTYYLVLWLTMIGYKTYDYFYLDDVTQSVTEWTNCVFQHYNGNDDNSWLSICGEKASHHAPVSLAVWFVVCISGHSIFITLIYMPAVYEALSMYMKTRMYAQGKKEKKIPTKSRVQPLNPGTNTNDRNGDVQPRRPSPISQLLQGQSLSLGNRENHTNNSPIADSNGDRGLGPSRGSNSIIPKTPTTKVATVRGATRTDLPLGSRNIETTPSMTSVRRPNVITPAYTPGAALSSSRVTPPAPERLTPPVRPSVTVSMGASPPAHTTGAALSSSRVTPPSQERLTPPVRPSVTVAISASAPPRESPHTGNRSPPPTSPVQVSSPPLESGIHETPS